MYEWTPLKSKRTLQAKPEYNISLLLEKGDSIENYETEVMIDKDKMWPINQSDQVGKIAIKKDGNIVREHPLIVKDEVEEANIFNLWKRVIRSIHFGDFTSKSN